MMIHRVCVQCVIHRKSRYPQCDGSRAQSIVPRHYITDGRRAADDDNNNNNMYDGQEAL